MMFESETILSITLLLPSIAAVAIFVYGFIGWSVRVSLSKWKGLNPDFTWVGLAQYAKLFQDARFKIDVRNTVMFTLLFIAACLIIGLALAILLDQKLKGEAIFRSIFLFPMSISFIASGVVWGWLMNPIHWQPNYRNQPDIPETGTYFAHQSVAFQPDAVGNGVYRHSCCLDAIRLYHGVIPRWYSGCIR